MQHWVLLGQEAIALIDLQALQAHLWQTQEPVPAADRFHLAAVNAFKKGDVITSYSIHYTKLYDWLCIERHRLYPFREYGMNPTRIYLVRHGQVLGHEQKRYNGQSEVALTEKGRAQYGVLEMRLRGRDIKAVYSSDLGRCVEGAQISYNFV